LTGASWWLSNQSVIRATDVGLQARVEGVRDFLENPRTRLTVEGLQDEFGEYAELTRGEALLEVIDAAGVVLVRPSVLGWAEMADGEARIVNSSDVRPNDRMLGKLPFRVASARIEALGRMYRVTVAAPMGPAYAALNRFHRWLLLLLPAILAVWMISFVRAIENFEVPALIGMPAGILVFATEVYLATKNVPTDFGLASTFGVVYLAITALGVVLYLRWTAASEQFATITGKGYRPTVFDLGPWRKPLAALSLFVCLLIFIMPILVVVWSSFLPFYMAPSRNALASLTLENYQALWHLPLVQRAMWNSFVLGIASSTITMVLTAIVAWIIVRTQWRGKGSLDFLAFSPIAMPGLVLGIAILWLYLVLPVPVYGTLWILLIAYVTKYLPYGMRACSSSMLQIKKELEEASEASGATWSDTFRRVILPLLAPGRRPRRRRRGSR